MTIAPGTAGGPVDTAGLTALMIERLARLVAGHWPLVRRFCSTTVNEGRGRDA